jgi:hypothetical protein
MERIESGPQCCPASSPRSVSTRPPIVESALMEATEVNLFHVSLTQTPPHFRPTASSPRRLDFLWTKKVSSRWHQFMASCALLLRRMASWKRRFSPRRSLLTTRGADTGDFKSPALALGRGFCGPSNTSCQHMKSPPRCQTRYIVHAQNKHPSERKRPSLQNASVRRPQRLTQRPTTLQAHSGNPWMIREISKISSTL